MALFSKDFSKDKGKGEATFIEKNRRIAELTAKLNDMAIEKKRMEEALDKSLSINEQIKHFNKEKRKQIKRMQKQRKILREQVAELKKENTNLKTKLRNYRKRLSKKNKRSLKQLTPVLKSKLKGYG